MIIGPCAIESHEMAQETMKQAKRLNTEYVRLSLWKPRTKPGFEGIGEQGIPWLVEAAKNDLNPAFEPMLPEHAQKVVDAVLPATKEGKLMIWIGARNQNHYIQRELGRIAAQSDRITLMIKNQVWHNEKHWEGIIDHVLEGGVKKENLMLCHRGFAPSADNNPHGYRNVPDYDMAMRVKEKTGLPIVFDPSHTGGSVEKVLQITHEAEQHAFDGYIIEVHPNPKVALSDSTQQLTWQQYEDLVDVLYKKRVDHARSHQTL